MMDVVQTEDSRLKTQDFGCSCLMSCVLCLVSCFCLIFAVAATVANSAPVVDEDVQAIQAFQAAERLQAEGEAQEALSAYEQFLGKYPDTTRRNDILLKMARCHSRLGDDDSAIRTYLKLISDSPNSIEASQAVSLMINLYSRSYRFDEVITMAKHLAQQFPGTEAAAMALYRAAGHFYSQRQFQAAIQEYENFMNQFPESIMRSTAFNRLISLYITQGMFGEAKRKLMSKLTENPEDTYMLRQLALVYQKQGEYDRALDLYQQILAASPNDVDIYERLGELYAERGDKEKAIAEWSKITESAPGQYSRHQMLAHILKSHGFYDQAATEYRKAMELQPMISYLYAQLADLYVVRKQFDSAIDVYLDALMKFPINLPSRSRITATMLELCDLEGLYDQVISRLRNHLISSPDSVPALLALADVYFHQGNFDASLQQFRIIASFSQDRGELLFDRAQTLERERQFNHAIKFYQTVLDLSPDNDISSQSLMRIGQLRAQLHQPHAAISSLRTLILQAERENIGSYWLPAYVLIGDIYLHQVHDVQAALSTYMEARSILDAGRSMLDDPASSIQHPPSSIPNLDLRIAECYRIMGKYDAANDILDSIQSEHKSSSIAAQVAKLRGDCDFSRGDLDSALNHYQKAVQRPMNEDWVNDSLDRIALIKEYSDQGLQALLGVHAQVERLRKSGQYDEALAICVSAAKDYAAVDRIQLEIGDLLALQMKGAEAISAYEELIQSNSPLAPDAQFRIARIYWRQLGDPKRAVERYSALIESYPGSVLVAEARKQIRQIASERTSGNNLP